MINLLRKHPVITFTALLIIALLIYGFWPQAILVEAVKVSKAPMTITIEDEGRTRVIDRYVIAAPVSGVTCRVDLDVGDMITQGQTLLTITPLESAVLDPRSRAQAEARLAAAKSALQAASEQAKAAVEANKLAILELNRYEPLVKKGAISRDQYDRALNQANTTAAQKRTADFNVEVSRYELEAAQVVLEHGSQIKKDDTVERIPLRSPINGRILKINRQCEGPVNIGETLLEVGDPSALEIEVDVLSADAIKILPGMPVRFERWGGSQPLHGKVRTVEPAGFTKVSALGVEEQRVLIISDLTSPAEQWQQLGDGYRVEANFIIWHEEDVLQIPASSLFRHNDQWAVYKIENNEARLQTVRIGKHNGLAAQVLQGLSIGDQLIDHPGNEVENDRKIKIR
ncbi:MAG: HlyD family efflux transporter periplasmic adaptor subunit [Gammaproteobacteria bacterium]|nr:HlyD family efflux transporter periplasmic adaptor subunit [Gammaproteobacteria bacterium]